MCIDKITDLYKSTFERLEHCILIFPNSQVDLLHFYTSLLQNWTVSLSSSTPSPFAKATINSITLHANTLASTILNTSLITTHAASGILSFYECSAALISLPSLQNYLRITTPPSELVYSLHFTSSLSILSRLCAILALYKRAFETAMNRPAASSPLTPGQSQEAYPKDYVNHFNGFLMDICNCLWRSRAFNTSDTNALGCLLPSNITPILSSYVSSLDTGLAIQSLFSLSYSPVLCNLSIAFLRDLEDKANNGRGVPVRHAGPDRKSTRLNSSHWE